MCRRITCPKCGRPGFEGCGMHVEQVLRGVPVEQRCACAQLDDTPEPTRRIEAKPRRQR